MSLRAAGQAGADFRPTVIISLPVSNSSTAFLSLDLTTGEQPPQRDVIMEMRCCIQGRRSEKNSRGLKGSEG